VSSIRNRLLLETTAGEQSLVANTAERCRQSLIEARASLLRAHDVAATDEHDLVALELRAALEHLGQVVGAVVTDDILDRIFRQFCIGK
jgi:tRNA modification GTPase